MSRPPALQAYAGPRALAHLSDFATGRATLTADNLAVRSAKPVHNIAAGPPGAYWGGGITGYHWHLDCAAMPDGLVLHPHFQRALVPGWLDKALKHRHRASAMLANGVVLAPHPDRVRTLPGAKLPDRADFKAWQHDPAGHVQAWQQAVAAAQQLADEAADWLARSTQDALPL